MSTTIKGPGLFLAQFASETAPFDTLEGICKWAADLGYKGVQIPTWVSSFIDLEMVANSKTYADVGIVNGHGIEITELSTHLQGQLVAVHPVFDQHMDVLAPATFHDKPAERQAWAVQQLMHAARASGNLAR